MIMAQAVTMEAKSGRELYLYDAFEGIPGYGGSSSFLENSEKDVKSYFDLFTLLDDNVHFVKVGVWTFLVFDAFLGEGWRAYIPLFLRVFLRTRFPIGKKARQFQF